MSFKSKLTDHFKNFDAAPVLFIGSGMSRRYLNIPCWEDLLNIFSETIGESHIKIKTQSNGDLTSYAENLSTIYAEKWWDSDECREFLKRDGARDLFVNQQSPLKISISEYVKKIETNIVENDEIKEELDLLSKANIDGIITTNWDCFLEHIFPKFTRFIGQDELITGAKPWCG